MSSIVRKIYSLLFVTYKTNSFSDDLFDDSLDNISPTEQLILNGINFTLMTIF